MKAISTTEIPTAPRLPWRSFYVERIVGLSRRHLVVEAQVAQADIDKIALAVTSIVCLSAFNLRSTPELQGLVVTVSPDRFMDEATGQPYCKARTTMGVDEPAKLARVDEDLALLPGTPAEVIINTGERMALTYSFKPFIDSLARTFRGE